jgi:hypothetical protein
MSTIPDDTIQGEFRTIPVPLGGPDPQARILTNFEQQIIQPARLFVPWLEFRGEGSPMASPTGEATDQTRRKTRKYLVPYDFVDEAYKDLLGYPMVVQQNPAGPGAAGGWYISRYLPDSIPWLYTIATPFEHSHPFLYCTEIPEEIGLNDVPDDGITRYDWFQNRCKRGLITAVYETLPYDVWSDYEMIQAGMIDAYGNPDESWVQLGRYVERQTKPLTKYQTFPMGSFVLAIDGATPYPGQPGRLEIQADFTVTWHRVPREAIGFRLINPWIAGTVAGNDYIPSIEDCLGSVNVAPFAGERRGTMLLTAAVFKPCRSVIGQRLYDVDFIWSWFGKRSTNTIRYQPPDPPGGNAIQGYQYGHNLLCYVYAANPKAPLPAGVSPWSPGYYELVSPATPNATVAMPIPSSNYLASPPQDDVNLFRYRDHAQIFRCPFYNFEPGNGPFVP